jgi:succinyl-CoA synthetase beta subunit
MARAKLTEFAAKSLLRLAGVISGWDGEQIKAGEPFDLSRFGENKLVVKVDQGVKSRGKKGLVRVGVSACEVGDFVSLHSSQYIQYLVEPLGNRARLQEQYLSLERVRGGFRTLYHERGGIEIESEWEKLLSFTYPAQLPAKVHHLEGLIEQIISVCDQYDWSFVEINPFVFHSDGSVEILDCAVLVDDASPLLTSRPDLARSIVQENTLPAEKVVAELDANTPASLQLKILNPDGSLWTLLSGGGASIVAVDEAADAGYAREIGNYGEYSGNPSREDVQAYANVIIESLLASRASRKVLLIAGGVANFTDIAKTFSGIIDAIEKYAPMLRQQGVRVFVRRGGPNQVKGLSLMRACLEKHGILGHVTDQSETLSSIVRKACEQLNVSHG